MIYVGAQKNMGPAGLAIMIVRKDPLGKASSHGPAMVGAKSLPKTTLCPILPTFGFYLAGLVFGWLKNQGGLAAMEIVNRRKADKLYGYIGSSNFYSNPVESAS